MNINIKIIPNETQRYPTVGDWFYEPNGDLTICVSKMSDWRREMLVAVHELVEVLICKHEGITQEQVDQFDKAFEEKRSEDNEDEAGDEPDAPYVKQHCIATGIERIMADQLGVPWKLYELELNTL